MRVVRATPPAHAISAEGRPLTDESGVVRGDRYNLPTWAEFEFGTSPVLWEPKQPKAGETMTVWYNPELTALKEADYVAFNGAPLVFASPLRSPLHPASSYRPTTRQDRACGLLLT